MLNGAQRNDLKKKPTLLFLMLAKIYDKLYLVYFYLITKKTNDNTKAVGKRYINPFSKEFTVFFRKARDFR
jgi:hypothetical protein